MLVLSRGLCPAVNCFDLATFSEVPATIVGTNSSEVLRGTSGRDMIAGLDGNDIILGLGGPAEPFSFVICNGQQGTDLAVPATCELEIQIEGDFIPPPAAEQNRAALSGGT